LFAESGSFIPLFQRRTKILRLEEAPLLLHGEITTDPPAIAEAAKFRSSLVVKKS
jgi:hypothetical protein